MSRPKTLTPKQRRRRAALVERVSIPIHREILTLDDIGNALAAWDKVHPQGSPSYVICSRDGYGDLLAYTWSGDPNPGGYKAAWFGMTPLIDPNPAAPLCRVE